MLSSLTIVNAQMTTVTNLTTTSTTFVATSVSYWVMTDSTEYNLGVGSYTVAASPPNACSVLAVGPAFHASSGDIISVEGTTDSPILLGPAMTGDVDYFQSSSQGTPTPGFACGALGEKMVENGGANAQGRFSMNLKLNGYGYYYLVFLNFSPSAVNVNVDSTLTRFTLFTNTLIETSTVTTAKTVTQVGVAPSLIYLIKDNIQLVVAVVLLCLVASALGLRQRTRRKKPASDTEEPVAVTDFEKPSEISPDRNQMAVVDTKFCRNCGAKIPRDSTFCEECGKSLL